MLQLWGGLSKPMSRSPTRAAKREVAVILSPPHPPPGIGVTQSPATLGESWCALGINGEPTLSSLRTPQPVTAGSQ